ncbi:hypothetical protein L1887_01968 [Cichorium endivia]|nr:hypothetical protein L1887_01968 [Cichorium endivia]
MTRSTTTYIDKVEKVVILGEGGKANQNGVRASSLMAIWKEKVLCSLSRRRRRWFRSLPHVTRKGKKRPEMTVGRKELFRGVVMPESFRGFLPPIIPSEAHYMDYIIMNY